MIVGREGVGKSALIIQLIEKNFKYKYDGTIIKDSFRHRVTIDAEPCLLDIFESTTVFDPYPILSEWQRRCIHMAGGFLCAYAINCRSSFDEIASLRSKLLLVKDQYTFPMVLEIGRASCRERVLMPV